MKTLILFLLLASVSLADSLVLVTQEKCPPCEVAKKLLAATDLQGLELKEVLVQSVTYGEHQLEQDHKWQNK